MKTSVKFLLTSIMLLAFASFAPAQKKRACPVPPPSPFKHDGAIATSFDRTSGMRTTLEHPRVINAPDGGFYLTASFRHQSAQGPSRLALDVAFISASKSARYRDSHNLVFYADGKELPFVGAAAQYQTTKGERGLLLEATRVTVPYAMLLKLTQSRQVAARIGSTQFALTNNHLEALRELVSLMAPPPSTWATASSSAR